MVPSTNFFARVLLLTSRVMRDTGGIVKRIRAALLLLLVTVFGRWRWESPAWLRVAGSQGARGWR